MCQFLKFFMWHEEVPAKRCVCFFGSFFLLFFLFLFFFCFRVFYVEIYSFALFKKSQAEN